HQSPMLRKSELGYRAEE
ncbi:hypothetical protein D044_3153B, partial [Vibrio parahaemolyticus EKP-026]